MYFEKKEVKKLFILAIFTIALCIPLFVFSQGFGLPQTATKSGFDTGSSDIYTTIGNIVNVAFATLAFIFFGLTVYAGLRWVTARGQENLIEKAKSTMEAAIIGLIIIALSYVLATFIISRLAFSEQQTEETKKPGCCIYSDSCINVTSKDDCTNGGSYYPVDSDECLFNVDCP